MSVSRITAACLLVFNVAGFANGDELKPVKSIDELLDFLEVEPDETSRTLIVDKAHVFFDIPDFAKMGTVAQLKIVSSAGPRRQFIIDNATWTANGKTVDAFHGVWGPDGTGNVRFWEFRSEGSACGGQVYRRGDELVVKMKGSFKPTGDAAGAKWGPNVINWTGDFVLSKTEEGHRQVQMRNVIANGIIKFPDFAPEVGRIVEE